MTGTTKTWAECCAKPCARFCVLALAFSLGSSAWIAALGQAPAIDPSRQASSPVGNSVSVPVGALSGKLTDLHSTPLDGATLVLRNTVTGVEARTVTQKNGSYRFTGLPVGEYTLRAESKRLGQGSLEGIFVSPGTEARVQAAMDFSFSAAAPEETAGGLQIRSQPETIGTSVQSTSQAVAIAPPAHSVIAVATLRTDTAPVEASLALALVSPLTLTSRSPNLAPPLETAVLESVVPGEQMERFALPSRELAVSGRAAPPLETAVILSILPAERPLPLELTARPAGDPIPIEVASTAVRPAQSLPAATLRAAAFVSPLKPEWALEVVKGIGLSHAAAQMAMAQARLRTLQAARERVDPVTPVVATTLTAEQVQSLPVAGRRWQNFVLDTPTGSAQSAGAATSANRTNATEATIDGMSTRLAFGSASGSGQSSMASGSADGSPPAGMAAPWASGHGLQLAESAIREVQSAAGNVEAQAVRAAGGHIGVTTQQGGPGFHGQAFLFDRQNTWGARNPFTTWVQETAPASSGAVPQFTAEPYTPPDHEIVWGFGAGSEWKTQKLFWFGALDRYQRNDPGLATVKHPDEFFAQPANDQMQVLSARLGLPAANPVAEGLPAYSTMLETLAGLLGPAARTASQWVGFARVDWQAAERHRFTLEAIGARWSAPGGGLTRVSQAYGNHSFGNGVASEELLMGRWEAFVTSNLLAVTQASSGRNILATHAEAPSTFEQTLLGPSIWGQLPQIVVDNRYGFTIGNPSRFGRGSYPDEKMEDLKQSVEWVRGALQVKAGFELAHNADATSLLRNQTGTYHYASVENFVSDALAFQRFGLAGELNPNDQHNCDQTGRVWTDTGGTIRGLGYLPCYSYYSQVLGPSGWHLSTSDWAGFGTLQWQAAKRIVLSAGLRWEREQLPVPIADLDNPELPLTQRMPSLGNNWGPRLSMAVGSGESHWPVLRLGYGMYFSRTRNQLIETALTQTGSFNGDLNFFLRPTDNLNQGGAPPFPYVLAGAPGSVVKPGALEFAPQFHSPEVHQAVVALEEHLPGHIQVTASAALSLGRRLPVTVDANLAAPTSTQTITYNVCDQTSPVPNSGQCGHIGLGPIKSAQITVPFYASTLSTGNPGWLNPDYQEIDQITSKANSIYESGMLKVERYGRKGLTFHAHYTYGHAMDWNPDESPLSPDIESQGKDFRQEYGTSDLDMRHSAAIMAVYQTPWKLHGRVGNLANGWMLSAIGDFRSGLPYTMRTAGSLAEEFTSTGSPIVGLGPGMNGSGGAIRVYGIGSDGVVYNIGRNTYRYPATWKADLRLGKSFDLGQMRKLELLVESFNLFNHQNVTELETTGYTIESGHPPSTLGAPATPPTLNFLTGLKISPTTGLATTAFGQPLNINSTDFFRERQIQVGMRMRF